MESGYVRYDLINFSPIAVSSVIGPGGILMNILFFLTPKSELAYVKTDSTIKEAMDIMEQHRHKAIPMIDKRGRYAGIISEGDLLYNIKNNFAFNMKDAAAIPVSRLDVRRIYDTVSINSTVEEVFKKSMSQTFVPLVDDDDIFIGIVKRRDIIQYFYNKYIHDSI